MSGAKCSTFSTSAKFPADEVVALASRRSMGVDVSYGDRTLKCKALEHSRFQRRRYLPDVGGRCCVEGMVAQNRRRRRCRDRQLVGVADGSRRAADRAEVNADAVSGFVKKNIIANPNCSTAQLVWR